MPSWDQSSSERPGPMAQSMRRSMSIMVIHLKGEYGGYSSVESEGSSRGDMSWIESNEQMMKMSGTSSHYVF